MLNFITLFRSSFLLYLILGIIFVGLVYDYLDKNYPHINLPFKEKIFEYQKKIMNEIDKFLITSETGRKIKQNLEENMPQ